MSRPITTLTIFFLVMNLWSTALIQTGAAGDMGIDVNVGGDQALENTTNQADSVSSGAPTGQTLFGMYNVLSTGLTAITSITTAGPTMLAQAAPAFAPIANIILKPLFAVVIAIGVISFLRGWDL